VSGKCNIPLEGLINVLYIFSIGAKEGGVPNASQAACYDNTLLT